MTANALGCRASFRPLGSLGLTGPRGDMNCNQVLDTGDITPLVLSLLFPDNLSDAALYLANLNGDLDLDGNAILDGRDAVQFTHCATGGNCP